MTSAAEKKEKKPRRVGKRAAAKENDVEAVAKSISNIDLNNRSSSGVLTSEKNSRDVKVFSADFRLNFIL